MIRRIIRRLIKSIVRIKSYHRYELKYLLSKSQCRPVIEALTDYLSPDSMGAEGRYSVTSLYYDTADYKAYWDKLEGHRFRRKVRVRVYGRQIVTAATPCFVEIKERLNSALHKERVILPYSEAVALCGAGAPVEQELSEADRAAIEQVQYLHDALQLQPACVVSYNRLAFDGGHYEPGLRITFDTQLKGRVHDLSLLSQSYADNRYLLPPDWCVMEVKVNYRVPYWLTELIGQHRCTLRRISKYCTALEHGKALLQAQQIVY